LNETKTPRKTKRKRTKVVTLLFLLLLVMCLSGLLAKLSNPDEKGVVSISPIVLLSR
jgi:hypothetical protein